MAPLDFAVNVAFPAIGEAFSLQAQALRWLVLCYVITYGSLLLWCGALGDRWGHLRIFRWGLWLALIALCLCSFAPTYPWLLAGRVLQGLAVALTLSCSTALVLGLMPDRQRTRALAIQGGMSALAGMAAPVAGGFVMLFWGWPGVFGFRVPMVLLALAGLPLLARRWHAAQAAPQGPAAQRGTVPTSGLWHMLRLLQRNADFAWVNLCSVVIQFASFALLLLLPYELGPARDFSSLQVGGLLSLWAAGVFAGSAWVPQLLSRLRSSCVLDVSMLGVCAGLGLVASWSAGLAWPWMGLTLFAQGLCLGVFQVAYADLVVSTLPDSDRGVSGSLTWVTRTVGVVAGALVWLWLMAWLQHEAVLTTIGYAAGVAGVLALVSVWRHNR